MASTQPAPGTICCDGCSLPAAPEHLRRRIARLEWASRFRPIHISTLLVTLAPPAALEDFFYYPRGLPSDPAARSLLEDLFAAVGAPVNEMSGTGAADWNREPCLASFQRCGLFLASCVECPFEETGRQSDSAALADRLAPTLALRIRGSYRPQSVIVLGDASLAGLAEKLIAAGIDQSLIRNGGTPLGLPGPGDSAARERFRSALAAALLVT